MAMKFQAQKAVREKIFTKIAIMSPSGGGKALTLDSDLMTPNGPIKMGDVKVGDEIFGTDGLPHKVLGVYPQGKKPCYRVTFSDGSCVDCSEDHYWTIRKSGSRYYHEVTLKEIMQKPLYQKGWMNFIPMAKPVQFEEKEQKIHPYVMGVLIGDGSLTVSHAVFTNSENDIVEKVESLLDEDMEIHSYVSEGKAPAHCLFDVRLAKVHYNRAVNYLKEIGLIGHKSEDKFIPDVYKYGSIEQRIELMRGLIDTDGEVWGKNRGDKSQIIISTASNQLAKDIQFVINSLGGTAKIAKRTTFYSLSDGEKSEGFESYRLYIKMPKDIQIFSSEKHCSAGYEPQNPSYRSIRNIESLGELDCQCIEVDAEDHLFLTNNFIATHNTFSSLRMATGMAEEIGKLTGTKGRILVANTEGPRGRYYANEFDYDIVDLEPPYNPELFVDLIKYAVEEKYDILVIDSSSAEWEGKGGCLELQQLAGGTYQAWAKVTPRHDKFIQAVASSPIHIIATMRGKDQYEIEKSENGKTNVKKLGVGAKQRDGFEYEFTATFTVDVDSHLAKSQKDNTHIFDGEGLVLLTEEHGKRVIDWANSGNGFNTAVKKFQSAPSEPSTPAPSELEEKKAEIASIIDNVISAEKLSRENVATLIKKHYSVNGRASAVYTKCEDVAVLDAIIAELKSNL